MTVDVAVALKSPGKVFHAVLTEAFPPFEYLGGAFRFDVPVTLETDYVYTGTHVLFTGHFATRLITPCARCLDDAAYPMGLRFEEPFSKVDAECYEIAGDTADLKKVVMDNILLNLPSRFLCREDCKGLCPSCGADLNTVGCKCQPNDQN